jgi:hypothetical protein
MSRRVKITGDLFHRQVPDGTVYVGRAAPGLRRSPYANPFPVKTYGRPNHYAATGCMPKRSTLRHCAAIWRAKTSPAGADQTSLAMPMCCWS